MPEDVSWGKAVDERQARISAESYRAAALSAMTEDDMRERIREAAGLGGWKWYHPRDSRRSTAGWPDDVLCRQGRLWCLELKRQGKSPTKAQQEWVRELATVPGVRASVIRPEDLDRLVELLVMPEAELAKACA